MARNSALEAEVAVLQQRDRQMQQLSRELKHEMTVIEELPHEMRSLMQRASHAEAAAATAMLQLAEQDEVRRSVVTAQTRMEALMAEMEAQLEQHHHTEAALRAENRRLAERSPHGTKGAVKKKRAGAGVVSEGSSAAPSAPYPNVTQLLATNARLVRCARTVAMGSLTPTLTAAARTCAASQEEGVHQLTSALTEVEVELAHARAEAASGATLSPSPPKEVMLQAALEAVRKEHAAFKGEQASRVASLEELAALQQQELDAMRRADDTHVHALATLQVDRDQLVAELATAQQALALQQQHAADCQADAAQVS
jgi:chromosome segregation ATPase